MKIQPIKNPQPVFGWKINQQFSRYGSSFMKSTEYHTDNGLKLLVIDKFQSGKQVLKTKELYNNKWQLIKRKIIDFVNGKRNNTYYI